MCNLWVKIVFKFIVEPFFSETVYDNFCLKLWQKKVGPAITIKIENQENWLE